MLLLIAGVLFVLGFLSLTPSNTILAKTTHITIRTFGTQDSSFPALIALSEDVFGSGGAQLWKDKLTGPKRPILLGVFVQDQLVSFLMGFETTLSEATSLPLSVGNLPVLPYSPDGKSFSWSESEPKLLTDDVKRTSTASSSSSQSPQERKPSTCFQVWVGGTHKRYRRQGFFRTLKEKMSYLISKRGYSKIIVKTQQRPSSPIYSMCLKEGMTATDLGGVTLFSKNVLLSG